VETPGTAGNGSWAGETTGGEPWTEKEIVEGTARVRGGDSAYRVAFIELPLGIALAKRIHEVSAGRVAFLVDVALRCYLDAVTDDLDPTWEWDELPAYGATRECADCAAAGRSAPGVISFAGVSRCAPCAEACFSASGVLLANRARALEVLARYAIRVNLAAAEAAQVSGEEELAERSRCRLRQLQAATREFKAFTRPDTWMTAPLRKDET